MGLRSRHAWLQPGHAWLQPGHVWLQEYGDARLLLLGLRDAGQLDKADRRHGRHCALHERRFLTLLSYSPTQLALF